VPSDIHRKCVAVAAAIRLPCLDLVGRGEGRQVGCFGRGPGQIVLRLGLDPFLGRLAGRRLHTGGEIGQVLRRIDCQVLVGPGQPARLILGRIGRRADLHGHRPRLAIFIVGQVGIGSAQELLIRLLRRRTHGPPNGQSGSATPAACNVRRSATRRTNFWSRLGATRTVSE
jgi:hypothetical protein